MALHAPSSASKPASATKRWKYKKAVNDCIYHCTCVKKQDASKGGHKNDSGTCSKIGDVREMATLKREDAARCYC